MKELVAVLYNYLEKGQISEDQYYKDVETISATLQKINYAVIKIGVNRDINNLVAALTNTAPAYVFNLCEEVADDNWGEIYVAGIMELLKIRYTGSRPHCLALSLDKARTKDVLSGQDIPIPQYQVFDDVGIKLRNDIRFPLIIKPLYEDGSFGIDSNSVVTEQDVFYEKIEKKIREFKEGLIVEEYIKGREMNIAIIGNGKSLRILPISEIDYSSLPPEIPKIVSYKAKWEKESLEYKGTIPICPAPLSTELKGKLEQLALKVYSIMKCSDYARIDIRLSEGEIPYVIDVNPNPCISPDSGFIRCAKAGGLDYETVIKEIINSCQERHRNGNAQTTISR